MFTRFHHYVVAVSDLEKTAADYQRIFGVQKPAVHSDARGHREAIVYMGDSSIHLCQSLTPDGAFAKFIQERGEGLYSVALEETDMAAALERLKRHGVRSIPTQEPNGVTVHLVHPKATMGLMYELYPRQAGETSPMGTGPVQRIGTVAHGVKSVDASLVMYEDLFGLKPDSRGVIVRPDAKLRSAWFPVGPGSIEVMEPWGEGSDATHFLERRGEGLYCLSMRVKGLGAFVEELKSKGVRLLPGATPQLAWMHPKETHGMLFEMSDADRRAH